MEQLSVNARPTYDYLFIGLGAANCLLILSLHENDLLQNKKIAIVEPSSKTENDRTFCFWATKDELSFLQLENLVSSSWEVLEISGVTKQNIYPLQYHHIKGIDLYTETKRILGLYPVTYIHAQLLADPKVTPHHYEIELNNKTFLATKVFDSRPPFFFAPEDHQSHVLQSFYGWKIKTAEKVFDPSVFVMMDFNIPQNGSTQFIYILPFEKDSALIELTRFGETKLSKEEAHLLLIERLKELGVSYEIEEQEVGVIPMSSAKIKVDNFGENWVNMGARANLLKCSTGYAFHAMAEDAILQMQRIKNNLPSTRETRKKRFLFYDRLLLKIVSKKPQHGKAIFEILFRKVPSVQVLRFLREKTTISEEISILSKLPKRLFAQTAIKDIYLRAAKLPLVILPFSFTILALLLSMGNGNILAWSILLLGFFTIGLAHGALDHLTSKKITTNKQLFFFSVNYIVKGILLAMVWYFSADLALLLFILYSAWHFGQADFEEWQLKKKGTTFTHPFFWGLVVLLSILSFHLEELVYVLTQIPNLSVVQFLQNLSPTWLLLLQILTVAYGLYLALLNKSIELFFTLFYLLLASQLPLLMAFGIYFVGQHSFNGWRHLKTGLHQPSKTLFTKALPFTLGGVFLILFILFLRDKNFIGTFFIVLSCLSMPHVFQMHRFYTEKH